MATRQPRTPGAEQAADAAAKAAAEQAVPETPQEPVADLPNAIDIDAQTITAPVLTKQGWVCPAEKPRVQNF